jgi:hypothetical protein
MARAADAVAKLRVETRKKLSTSQMKKRRMMKRWKMEVRQKSHQS